MYNPFKLLLLTFFAPEFWKRIPKRQKGNFIGRAYTVTLFGPENASFEKAFNCRREAYLWARWRALCMDFNPKFSHSEIGIYWAVITNSKDAKH